MDKCETCNQIYEPTQKARNKCNAKLCQNWCHKQCCDKKQFAKDGYWFCKIHILEVPLENRNQNINDDVSEIDENENNENNEKDDNKNTDSDSNNDDKSSIKDDDKFTTPVNSKKPSNPNITKRRKKKDKEDVTPYDNDDDYNPFSNFNCTECDEKIKKESPGALCTKCRSIFHLQCLNNQELEDVVNFKFVCQYCIIDDIRIKNLNKKVKDQEKVKKKFIKSTPKNPRTKLGTLTKDLNVSIDTDTSTSPSISSFNSSNSSDSESEIDLIKKKYKKLKKLMKDKDKKKKSKSKNSKKYSKTHSESDDGDEDDHDITQSDALIEIYKMNRLDREKSKYEKLPIVDNLDTKWSVFFDLFKTSRKLFSDSENVLRIQRSIKSKEILEIGGVNLFDPFTYWETLKLIDDRLAKSSNLLLKETNEIIKLKKLRNDIEPKKLIEFINKIVNYNCIVEKYGKKKHKSDERIISHISNIMPYSMLNGWHKMKSNLEEKERTIYVKHLSEYLTKQVPLINSKMQAEETDPWKENIPKQFKKYDFTFKRSYNTQSKYNDTNKVMFCWLHDSESHSSFECYKLWELSGKEVSDLARTNEICTFCGLKRQKDCHADKTLNCKIEGCNLKHHILFCYKRPGKNNKNFSGYNNRSDSDRYRKSKNDNCTQVSQNTNINMTHRKDDKTEDPHLIDDKTLSHDEQDPDEDEIIIPSSNFYINNPPKSIKIKRNSNNSK